MPRKPLFRHLDEVGESYAEHGGNAAAFGLRMIAGGLACLVHAAFPVLFERTGSDTIRSLHNRLCKRVDRPNWERHPII